VTSNEEGKPYIPCSLELSAPPVRAPNDGRVRMLPTPTTWRAAAAHHKGPAHMRPLAVRAPHVVHATRCHTCPRSLLRPLRHARVVQRPDVHQTRTCRTSADPRGRPPLWSSAKPSGGRRGCLLGRHVAIRPAVRLYRFQNVDF
jgi:hypothetical protein